MAASVWSRPNPRATPRQPAAEIAAQTFSGLHGMVMWRTPRWLTASMIALYTEGMPPIVPDSPTPFAPSSLTQVGVSIGTSSKLGSSAAEMEERLKAFETASGWEGPNELLLTAARS